MIKKIIKKSLIIILAIFVAINTSACFDYKDINKIVFTTSTILDIDDFDNVIVYLEAFKAIRTQSDSSVDGQRLVFKGTGKTVFEAIRDISLGASYKVNYTQNKVILVTEKLANKGFDLVLDFFNRDEETLVKPYIMLLQGDAKKLAEGELKSEKYIGLFVDSLVKNVKTSARSIKSTVNEYYVQRDFASKTTAIPILEIKNESITQDNFEVGGIAILKEDKLAYIIPRKEGQGFNFLINNIKMGSLEVTNPMCTNKFVALDILKNKTKTKIKYDEKENKIYLYKDINMTCKMAEAQDIFKINKTNMEMLKMEAENNVKKYSTYIFEKLKEGEIDALHIQEEFERKYPRLKVQDIVKNTELKLSVNVKIKGTGTSNDFH